MRSLARNFISVLVACIMIIGAMPLGVTAVSGSGTESDPYIASTYPELKAVMADAPDDGSTYYIKLGNDIVSEDIQNDYDLTLTKENQNVVLDLAGHSITRSSDITVDQSVIRGKNGTLTINDSVGTGGVYAKGGLYYAVALTGMGEVGYDNGTIIINGGTYESEFIYGSAVHNDCSTLYIYGGSFKGCYGGYIQAGRTYIYDGDFYSTAEQDKCAISLGFDQIINVYNMTAYGTVRCASASGNLWQDFLHPTSEVYIDNEKQSQADVWKFEGNVVEIKTTMVDKIQISIDAPATGRKVDTTATVPSNAGYSVETEDGAQFIAWFDNNTFVYDTFEINKVYKVRMQIRVESPIMPDVYAEINGNKAVLEFARSEEEYSLYWVEYTFPATFDTSLKTAKLNIFNPVGNENAVGGWIFEGSKYSVYADWHPSVIDSDYGKLHDQPYIPGSYCYATFYFFAKDPYEFVDGTVVTINGKEYVATPNADDALLPCVYVHNVQFKVPETGTYTVTFHPGNGGGGYMEAVVGVSGEFVLPECTYITPPNMRFKAWSIKTKEYAVGTKINITGETTVIAVWESIDNPTTAKKGDINGNGTIDSMDYVLLKRAYFGTYKLSNISVGDINNNGSIDSMDYVYLRRAYFGTYVIK